MSTKIIHFIMGSDWWVFSYLLQKDVDLYQNNSACILWLQRILHWIQEYKLSPYIYECTTGTELMHISAGCNTKFIKPIKDSAEIKYIVFTMYVHSIYSLDSFMKTIHVISISMESLIVIGQVIRTVR